MQLCYNKLAMNKWVPLVTWQGQDPQKQSSRFLGSVFKCLDHRIRQNRCSNGTDIENALYSSRGITAENRNEEALNC
jgi:hypothetical protein